MKMWLIRGAVVLVLALTGVGAPGTISDEADFLSLAEDYAACMIRHGRDRYGRVHSPLFAVLLIRGETPCIGPAPRFADPDRVNKLPGTSFNRFDFNKVLNYPPLGGEGPHKVTLTGCDPYEDAALYEMLIGLSRLTGEPRYQQEAARALQWWFTHTQSPRTGLYPWGEHLGWDFETDCPTYFEGPSRHLYAACYHEIKDRVPFLDYLAGLPAAAGSVRTPLERYALGVWDTHYWDKERAIYCRHGDYTGHDDRQGSRNGFPAHQGAHLRLWTRTYLETASDDVRGRMERILQTVLDCQVARAKRYGFIPFTFDPELKGSKPKASGQDDRLARHSLEMSLVIADASPALAARMRELAVLVLGDEAVATLLPVVRHELAASPDRLPPVVFAGSGRPATGVARLSREPRPAGHARAIRERVAWYRTYGDVAYARAALDQATLARMMFCDAVCPLPRAFAGEAPERTGAGGVFPDYYFRGAGLMHAFALVGKLQRELGDRLKPTE